jgi:hypothetical protein
MAAFRYVRDLGKNQPRVSEQEYRDLEKVILQPLENYRVGRNEITAGTVPPSYLLPMHGLQRLQVFLDVARRARRTGTMRPDLRHWSYERPAHAGY